MIKRLSLICILFCSLLTLLQIGACFQSNPTKSVSQNHDSLRVAVNRIAQEAKGIVCVSIENLETGDTLSVNGNYHCPMQSVFKFPIALAILNMVDKDTLSLQDKIDLSKEDLSDTSTMSPMRDKYLSKDTSLPLSELIRFMVSESDNIACDILLNKAGGPKQVEGFIHGLGIAGIAIAATEKEMHSNTSLQYQSWCEPKEMSHLLKLFYEGKCLSKTSTDYLRKIMEGTETGGKRIKGLLPAGTVVAHKTGSSMTENGLAAATNDAGIITLPNGNHLIITVFVTDSKADFDTREAVIAKIAKAAYDEMGK
jgi:beta-lactamase class A